MWHFFGNKYRWCSSVADKWNSSNSISVFLRWWRWPPWRISTAVFAGWVSALLREFQLSRFINTGTPPTTTRWGPLTNISGFIPSYTHLQPWLNRGYWNYSCLITRGAPSCMTDFNRGFSGYRRYRYFRDITPDLNFVRRNFPSFFQEKIYFRKKSENSTRQKRLCFFCKKIWNIWAICYFQIKIRFF